jgi:hypothetical protein
MIVEGAEWRRSRRVRSSVGFLDRLVGRDDDLTAAKVRERRAWTWGEERGGYKSAVIAVVME